MQIKIRYDPSNKICKSYALNSLIFGQLSPLFSPQNCTKWRCCRRMSVRRACIVSDHRNRVMVQKIYHLNCYEGKQWFITIEVKEALCVFRYPYTLFFINLSYILPSRIEFITYICIFKYLLPGSWNYSNRWSLKLHYNAQIKSSLYEEAKNKAKRNV